jgi:hypothetical protein
VGRHIGQVAAKSIKKVSLEVWVIAKIEPTKFIMKF